MEEREPPPWGPRQPPNTLAASLRASVAPGEIPVESNVVFASTPHLRATFFDFQFTKHHNLRIVIACKGLGDDAADPKKMKIKITRFQARVFNVFLENARPWFCGNEVWQDGWEYELPRLVSQKKNSPLINTIRMSQLPARSVSSRLLHTTSLACHD